MYYLDKNPSNMKAKILKKIWVAKRDTSRASLPEIREACNKEKRRHLKLRSVQYSHLDEGGAGGKGEEQGNLL